MSQAEGTAIKREDFQPIFTLGRQQGFLTYEQLNELLPDALTPEQVYQLLDLLDGDKVELIDDHGLAERGLFGEREWLRGDHPRTLLSALRGRASDRKLRLFAVACCRRVWTLFEDPRSRRAVEAAESLADGLLPEAERRGAQAEAEAALWDLRERDTLSRDKEFYFFSAAEQAATVLLHPEAVQAANAGRGIANRRFHYHSPETEPLLATERQDEVALVHCIFGNPFRPAAVDLASVTWRGGTLPRLAQVIYEERAFDRLPVLADALEETGCTAAEILAHLRGPGPHARGCWAVDLLLGKA